MVITPSSKKGRDAMEMVYVPAGEFTMGSPNGVGFDDENPEHVVNLGAFWIDKTEVTNAMYAECVGENACQPPITVKSDPMSDYYGNPQYGDYPVTLVSWTSANTYCNWAGERLLTEAEWEKAARGTDKRTYPWGNSSPTCSLANYSDCVGALSVAGGHPDGASPYGALDMAGNLWEWVQDWYSASYYAISPLDNPQGPTTGKTHVVRGGSWFIVPGGNNDLYIRSANRGGDLTKVDSGVGFRCGLPDH
jgi:serine/threonine-protein kinase